MGALFDRNGDEGMPAKRKKPQCAIPVSAHGKRDDQIAFACSRGLYYYSCRRFAEAKILFLRALELDPLNSFALGYLKKTQKSLLRRK